MKDMKNLFFVIAFLLCGNALIADSSWSLTTGIYSKYVGKIGSVFSEDPILVNEIDWSAGDCFAGVWNSTGIDKYSYGSTYADETDLYVGCGHTFGWLRVQADVAYYTIKNLTRMNDDLWVEEGEISFPHTPIVQPYMAFREFNKVGRNSFPGGMFYWAGVRRAQPLGGQTLNLDLMTAYSNGALGKNSGPVFARLTANIPISLGKRTTLTPSVMLQTPIVGQEHHRVAYTTKNEIVWGLAMGYKL